MISQQERIQKLKNSFKIVNDFPKPGIAFLDIMPIFSDPELLSTAVDTFEHELNGIQFDAIVGLQVRGFLFGVPLAYKMKKPFIPIRKKGKLPGELLKIDYGLEYGKDTIQLQKGHLKPGQKIVLIDDVLATGGTLGAAISLVQLSQAQIVKILILADVPDLNGKQKLGAHQDKLSVLAHLQ